MAGVEEIKDVLVRHRNRNAEDPDINSGKKSRFNINIIDILLSIF